MPKDRGLGIRKRVAGSGLFDCYQEKRQAGLPRDESPEALVPLDRCYGGDTGVAAELRLEILRRARTLNGTVNTPKDHIRHSDRIQRSGPHEWGRFFGVL